MDLVWKVILLQIPQAFLFTYASTGLVGKKLAMRSLLPFAVVFGVIIEILRQTVFPWHALTLVVIQGIVQRYYFRMGWGTSFAAVFLGFLMINVGEVFLALAILPVLGWSLNTQDLPRLLAMGWMALIPLLVASYGVYRWNWVLFPLDIARRGERGAAR